MEHHLVTAAADHISVHLYTHPQITRILCCHYQHSSITFFIPLYIHTVVYVSYCAQPKITYSRGAHWHLWDIFTDINSIAKFLLTDRCFVVQYIHHPALVSSVNMVSSKPGRKLQLTREFDVHPTLLQKSDVDPAGGGIECIDSYCGSLSLSQILIESSPTRVQREHVCRN